MYLHPQDYLKPNPSDFVAYRLSDLFYPFPTFLNLLSSQILTVLVLHHLSVRLRSIYRYPILLKISRSRSLVDDES